MWENVKANPGAKAVFMDKYSWHLQSYYNGQQYEALKRHDVPALIFDVKQPPVCDRTRTTAETACI